MLVTKALPQDVAYLAFVPCTLPRAVPLGVAAFHFEQLFFPLYQVKLYINTSIKKDNF